MYLIQDTMLMKAERVKQEEEVNTGIITKEQ